MNDESKTPSNDADPERGLATPDILKRWLEFETMTLRHAALIAHGASPEAEGLGLYDENQQAVEDTRDMLSRVVKLTAVKGEGEQALYETSKIFRALAAKDHDFPAKVRAALLERKLISSGRHRVRAQTHGNAERHENIRTPALRAMIRVLADSALHPLCRKDGAADGAVIGEELAKVIILKADTLFENGKSPLKQGTIAKLFNEIVPPQVR